MSEEDREVSEELAEDVPSEELESLYRDHHAIRNWEPLASETASYFFALQDKGLTEEQTMMFALNFQATIIGFMWRKQ